MDFGLTEEQELIVRTVRGFVDKELYPLEAGYRQQLAAPRARLGMGASSPVGHEFASERRLRSSLT